MARQLEPREYRHSDRDTQQYDRDFPPLERSSGYYKQYYRLNASRRPNGPVLLIPMM